MNEPLVRYNMVSHHDRSIVSTPVPVMMKAIAEAW